MNKKYGPGGWCKCEHCNTFYKHTFVTPCCDTRCSKCGRLLKEYENK